MAKQGTEKGIGSEKTMNGQYVQNDGQSGISRIAAFVDSLSTDGIFPPRIELAISTVERNDTSNRQYRVVVYFFLT